MTKETLIERIRNLRRKAADDASTEAEAMAAADAAARLIMKHDFTEEDLKEQPDLKATSDGFTKGTRPPKVLMECWSGIQALTETKVYRQGGTYKAIGLPQDVELACYLFEMITAAEARAWKSFYASLRSRSRRETNAHHRGFTYGFGKKLQERMLELAKERAAARPTAAGTALVVRKDALIDEHMEAAGLKITTRKRKAQTGTTTGYGAGLRAGSRVNLSRPVTGQNQSQGAIQ